MEYIEPNYAICLLEDAVIGDTTGESTTGEGTTGDTVTDSEELWPNDPLCSTGQLGLQGIYGLAGMEQELTGAGVVVGMVDSGVHAAHEDLNAENMSGSNYVSDELPYSVDSYGHGTVVAGVIAAQTNNGVGVAGIAPDAQLRVYRCFNSIPMRWYLPFCRLQPTAVRSSTSVWVQNITTDRCGRRWKRSWPRVLLW